MILAILFLSFVLRVISVNQSLWIDEATSVLTARDFSFSEIITKFSPGDFHPPLYYLILKIWTAIFGSGEVGVRLLSVMAGVGTVYFVYLIANKFIRVNYSNFPGIAALLLATSGLHIYYSQEARMYALSSLLVTFSIYLFLSIQKSSARIPWLLFSLSLPLIILTDYLSAFIFPVFWFFAIKKNKSWFKKFILANIPLVMAVIVWLPIFKGQLESGLSVESSLPGWWKILGGISVKEVLLVPVKFMLGRISFDNNVLYGLVVFFVGTLNAFLIVKATKFYRKTKILWFWILIPALLIFTVSYKIPVFYYFRLIFVLPAFYLITALGIVGLKPTWRNAAIGLVVAINLCASFYYLGNSKFHREDWRGLVNYVEEHSTKDFKVLFVADSQMEAYNYYSEMKNFSGPDAVSDSFDTIWLMKYVQPIFDPNDTLRKKVEDLGYVKAEEFDFNGVVVWRYKR